LQLIDDAADAGDGESAALMHHDDRSVARARHDALNDAIDIVSERIESAHAPADERHAAAGEDGMNNRFLHSDGRTKEFGPLAGDGLKRLAAPVDLRCD